MNYFRIIDPESRILYQFPLSHYCEKARWCLDFKGCSYDVINLFPGIHRRIVKKMGGKGTLPVLKDGKVIISDSTDIAYYLEKKYPFKSYIPNDLSLEKLVAERENYCDVELAPHIRIWMYGIALREPLLVPRFFFEKYGMVSRLLGLSFGKTVDSMVKKRYRITEEKIAESFKKIQVAISQIEKWIEYDPDNYIVGKSFSLADITAAAILAPLFMPEKSPWEGSNLTHLIPREILDYKQSQMDKPISKWVLAQYAKNR